ncbi:helix-turn-helix domain-containing protein [Streptomyces mirabilis]
MGTLGQESGAHQGEAARGITLRVSAAVEELKHRPSPLRQAVQELRRCDDLVEEAGAVADLGYTYQSLGDNKRSRAMMNHAWHLAKQCGAETLCLELSGMDPHQPTHLRAAAAAVSVAPVTESLAGSRSEAELRAASLAAFGYTNREVSQELVITVSTVERHPTRVYRKLDVGKRSQLPDLLNLSAAGQSRSA